MYKILIINLGSTSTKVAIYENLDEVFSEKTSHSQDKINKYNSIWDQEDFRKKTVKNILHQNDYTMDEFDVISCRGGNVKPVSGGIYVLNKEMIEDMRSGKYGVHPTNVGNTIAYQLGKEAGIPVVIADPPVTDEFHDLARFSGLKEISRMSSFHALNQKRTARKVAEDLRVNYEDINLIVAHLGGGISVAAHNKGKVIDVNNALDGDGPFSPERSGTLPVGDLIRMCFMEDYSQEDMIKKVRGKGGLMSYLETNEAKKVVNRINNGDEYAKKVYHAMGYQVAKEIGAAATVLKGNVKRIALTGGMAHSDMLTDWIIERVKFIAPVVIVPGENEMLSLAENALRYLKGEEEPKEY